ncbi:MAG: hypothetical protein HY063_11020 [Bacteroidetes bacterium]|nr:hypothetical protein [Bacteroidota bacterium]
MIQKTILILIILSVCVLNCYAQGKETTDLQRINLTGKVKSIHLTAYENTAWSDKPAKWTMLHKAYPCIYDLSADMNEFLSFDNKGRTTEKKHYYEDNKEYKTITKYDVSGNKIETIDYRHDTITGKITYKYDGNGKITESSSYNENKLRKKIIYKYDTKGNTIEENEFDDKEKPSGKIICKYDDKGKMIEKDNSNAKGMVTSKNIYTHNEKGILTEENFYEPKDSLNKKIKYDDNGNKIEDCSYYKNKMTSNVTYQYDKKGNMLESIEHNKDGSIYRKWTHKYDDKGNKTEERIWCCGSSGESSAKEFVKYFKYDNNGNVITITDYRSGMDKKPTEYKFEYEYDTKGNWVNRTTVFSDFPEVAPHPQCRMERIITYY